MRRIQDMVLGERRVIVFPSHPTEMWRLVSESSEPYLVSSLGRIWSVRSRHLLKPEARPNGYLRVCLRTSDGRRRDFSVHRLVASAFLGPRSADKDVHHINARRDDNRIENLQYATRAEHHANRLKTHCKRGHPFDAANTWRSGKGRHCRACNRDRMRAVDRRKASA